jgi:UDP:flavonoid glycosyltransferase YjiC (YdhE family)
MIATAQKSPSAKRVLVLPYGHALSHVTRLLEIARALRDVGHEVLFGGEGRYLELAREAGYPVLPLFTLDHDWVMARSRAGRADWWSGPLLERSVEAELALLAEQAPDVVLGDFRYSLSISCERAKIAYASLLNAAWTNYYTIRDRAPEHFAPTQLLGRALLDPVVPWLKAYILWADNGPARRLRKRMGLRPRRNVFDSMRGDLNLLADIPEYGPVRPEHLKSAVERVLGDRGYRDRMAHLAVRVRAYDAPRTSAALIGRL